MGLLYLARRLAPTMVTGIFGDSAGNIFLTEIQPSCVTRMRRL
jgi:hypothetical protein